MVWSGRTFDALSGDIDLSGAGLTVRNGSVQQGVLHLQGAGSLGMQRLEGGDASPISAAGSIRNAPAADLLAVADIKNVPVAGDHRARTAKISGTFGDPAYRRHGYRHEGRDRRRTVRPLHRGR